MSKTLTSLIHVNAKKALYFDAYNYINDQKILRNDIPVYNPATHEILCHIPDSKEDDIKLAVESAIKGQKFWFSKSCDERRDIMYKTGDILQTNYDNIVYAEVKDSGKPIWEAKMDVTASIDCIKYFAGLANTNAITGQYINMGENYAFVRREPIGVVAAIGVWNFPLLTATWKSGPALASGNALIFKPSPLTPLTSLMLAEAFTEAGLPTGCFNVVQGGAQTGSLLCKHPSIGKISFTGSATTGSAIVKNISGDGLFVPAKRLTLELGGKSPLIVFGDAPLEMAVKTAMMANFLTQGATCSNGTRVFVHDSGAKLVFGGYRVHPPGLTSKNGHFLMPAIFSECTDDMTICKEEIFGSVMCLLKFKEEGEVIERANNTYFGLSGGICTKDISLAHRVSSAIQCGTFNVNTFNMYPVQIPFGGIKGSGYGHECGLQSIEHYTQWKSVYVDATSADNPSSMFCPYFDGLIP
ncbi:4-trimethylaminobutyraldehyde dehydrogenase A-like isoform X2 [Gordionus sp. m RMFG-2023]|uniref:4-trimethylaminobutyraldehyde dehydrogenase A-like isoform X2 n=1 Tax=Gordionus sp. m RMFG-2023 TaxID=3053472 RepID=UPI0031FBBB0F